MGIAESSVPANATIGAAVSLIGLEKKYQQLTALRPTSIEIASGEFFCIIGPSGSGKSTLLGMIAGYLEPSGGQIIVDGDDIVEKAIYQRNIGMVFQNYALFPQMTVAENIGYPLKIRGVPKAEIRRRVEEAMSMVRLTDLGRRLPIELSGGQQQRVALARASIYRPSLLLMDEPLGALDKNLRDEMQEEIKRFQKELGTTAIYVTHDQQEAAFLGDRIAIMRDGGVAQIGEARWLYENPNSCFIAEFLGETTVVPILSLSKANGDLVMAKLADGVDVRLRFPGNADLGRFMSVRPERIIVGPPARALANVFGGIESEDVYTPVSVRYTLVVPN